MKKPLNCEQNWLNMKPTEGGRVCGKCEKTIVDFSEMSWKEVLNVQSNNDYSLCGMYSKKQLEHWGHEPPNSLKNYTAGLALTSILLTGLGLPSTKGLAQTPIDQQTAIDSSCFDVVGPRVSNDTVTVITGTVIDENGEPIMGANIYFLPQVNTNCISDINGAFRLETSMDLSELKEVTLVVNYIGFTPRHIPLADWVIAPTIFQVTMTEADRIVFYVKQPTAYRRIKWKVKSWFRRLHL